MLISPLGPFRDREQITQKLNKLRNNIRNGRRQTSWLCTIAAKDLNQVQLGKNPAASHIGTSFQANSKYALVELFREATIVSRTDILTRIENTLPEECLRSQSPSNRISFYVITVHLFSRRQQTSFIFSTKNS